MLKKLKIYSQKMIVSAFAALLLSFNSYAEPLVPQNIVDNFLSGYDTNQKQLINIDLDHLRNMIFHELKPAESLEYIATAGGPGASKSTILEEYLLDKQNFAYIDPDQRALRFMSTYLNELTVLSLSKNPNKKNLLKQSYIKWRGASNYISNTLLNEAFERKFNIAHGTTSTSPQINLLYEKLIQQKRKITLLLCYSTNENRINAINYRAERQNLVQSEPQDVIDKGKMFPERFENYFKYADKILFYWTNNFEDGSKLAATLVKGNKINIADQQAFEKFNAQYDEDRNSQELKNKNLKSLDKLIEDFSK